MNPWLTYLTVISLILIPILAAISFRRRVTATWLVFFAGCAVFALGNLILLPVAAFLRRLAVLPDVPLEINDILMIAVLTGPVFESARTIIFLIFRRVRTPSQAIMLGIGSGSLLIMVLAVLLATGVSSPTSGVINDITSRTSLNPSAQIASFIIPNGIGLLVLLFSLVMALLILITEINASYVVVKALEPKRWWLIPGAMLYHSLINGIVIFGLLRLENIWITAAVLFVFSVPLLATIGRSISWNDLAESGDRSLSSEMQLLIASLQKEILYHWRTRRIIIIGAVFLVFGMASPLIAKFTPSLLGLVEGGEQFADLIPTPTTADAVGQYVKNLTQFGFILAIVIGMGAVAGEKERNTAAMILSKPMPRWVFLVSKVVAQAVVFTISFALAMIAAYYYTVFLFGRIAILDFIGLNGLLLIWLLVFVTFTLLGSTIGRSTAAAAGIALLFCVILLVAGTLPRFGTFAPGGLITWASTIFIGGEVMVNGGSLTTSLILILLAILGSLAVFEEQEV